MILANDFKAQWEEVNSHVLEAVNRVGKSGWLVLGQEVSGFESELSEFCGLAHGVGCANGLDAIEISLRCLGIKPGDKVLTTPLSAFATSLAIIRAGGTPVFVDVDNNGLLDLSLAEKALKANSDIGFMVPVHLYGHSLNLEKLAELKNTYDLKIVEDSCQAIGAKFDGAPVGSVGQASCISFYPTKNLGAMGDGGALLTNDEAIANHARSLRDYGQTAKYEHAIIGLNSRLDELQAAILRDALLPRLKTFTQTRQKIAQRYLSEIQNRAIEIPTPPAKSESVWHLFSVIVTSDRDAFINHMKENEVAVGVHYPKLITEQEALAPLGANQLLSPLNNAVKFAQHEASLPIHPFLTDAQVDQVIKAVNNWKG